MFQITRNGDDRLDMVFSGKLDRDGMRACLDELSTQAHGIEGGRMLVRVGDFQLPTAGALAVELSHLPQLFRLIRQFDRCAVICAKDWIRTLSEIEGAVIPGLQVKSFTPQQETEVQAWLAS